MTQIRPREWVVALLLATAVHLYLVLAIDRPSGPAPAGPGTEIRLGFPGRGGDPGAAELRAAENGELSEVRDSLSERADADRVEALENAPLEAVAVSPEELAAHPVEEQLAASEPAAARVHRRPAPDSRTRTSRERAVAPREPAAPETRPIERVGKRRAAGSERETTDKSGASSRTAPDLSGKVTRGAGRGRGKAGTGRAGGLSGDGRAASRNYEGLLVAWLNKHKRYPRRARKLGQQGTTKIRFTIDGKGRLLSFRILKSSGHALLDQEVRDMLRRATPMPAMPDASVKKKLTVTVPVRFSLR